MGFRKVIVNEDKECPSCGGKSGLRYHVRVDFTYFIKWGESCPQVEKDSFYPVITKTPKTAKCIDCGKRVEFSIK